MKKYFISALACAVALVSCVKENNAPEQIPGKGEKITISATIPADGLTKVDLAEDTDGLKLTWAEGDIITVIDAANSGNFSVFELTGGKGTATGVFSGDALTGATSYIIQYDNVDKGFNYSEQTQATDGSTSHLKYTARLEGVSEYESFTFSEAWATSKGGTFARSSVLRVKATLPNIGDVHAVYIKADAPIFAGENEIKVTLEEAFDSSEPGALLTVYANLPNGDQEIAAGTGLLVQFQVSDNAYDKYTAYRELEAKTLEAGKVNTFVINCANIKSFANGSASSIGTEANPYLIGDQHQMEALMNLYKAADDDDKAVYYYVKLVDDIDMTGVEWVPFNRTSPGAASHGYGRAINFDGQKHTVSNLTVGSTVAYPSFIGVINGKVKDVVFEGATIVAGNNTAGVLAGYAGTGTITGDFSGITVKNSSVTGGTKQRLGGIVGYVSVPSEAITDCHVIDVTVESTADRVGGMFGETAKNTSVSNCTATGVSVQGSINIGGVAGVGYGNFTKCSSSGSVSSINTVSNKDIGLGGLVGYLEHGTISQCSSSVSINQTNNGRDIGGLVGKMLVGKIEKSYATGNVSGHQRNVGGLVGLITNTAASEPYSIITNCYATGNVTANAHSGGFVGLIEKGIVSISNCYSSGGTVSGNFGMGGFIGYQGSVDLTAEKCIAWVGAVTASSCGTANWSSGAVCGVTHPNCVLTNNYRNPAATYTMWWVPSSTYNHPDVNKATHPLVRIGTDLNEATAAETDLTAFVSDDGEACRWAYHGKIDANKTLSQLAATLEWDANVWDMNGSLPILKFE